MNLRKLPGGKWALSTKHGHYLGTFESMEAAETEAVRLKCIFDPYYRSLMVEQEAVERAIEGAMFVTTAEALKKKSQELNQELRKINER